jgi:cytoplasmic iron level regulating protein YaaA (DUF328/UPF0246 family)
MDAMLRAVLETDHRESERTQQLIETREMLFDDLRAQKEALFDAARSDALRDVEKISEKLNVQTEQRLEALRAQGLKAVQALTEYGEARREEWAAEAFRLALEG